MRSAPGLFSGDGFNLFPRSDWLYEEVETAFLQRALGVEKGSVDQAFFGFLEDFRRLANQNTRRLHFYWVPGVLAAVLSAYGAAVWVMGGAPAAHLGVVAGSLGASLDPAAMGLAVDACLGALLGGAALAVLLAVYRLAYIDTQRFGVVTLDSYITKKFSRIHGQYEVAKRKALNVEKSKQMRDAEALRDEASVWTISYLWLAMRLLFCEFGIRNTLFQIRRNTTLYAYGGGAVLLAALAGAWRLYSGDAGPAVGPVDFPSLAVSAGSAAAIYAVIGYGWIMRRGFAEIASHFDPEQWSRLHMADLPTTIADHVAEDKLQIVTFRDRNRFEAA